MLNVKSITLVLLLASLLAFSVACQGADNADPTPDDPAAVESSSSESPSESAQTATVSTTEEPRTIALPDESRALFEAWRIVQREYVDIDNIDPRVLSDGAIFGILDALEDSSLSIAQARALEYDLELQDNYFRVPGGDELERRMKSSLTRTPDQRMRSWN